MTSKTGLNVLVGVLLLIVLVGVAAWIYNLGAWQERVDDLQAQVDSTDNYWLPKYTADSTEWATQLDSLAEVNDSLVEDSTALAQQATRQERARIRADVRLQELTSRLDTMTMTPQVRAVLGAAQQAYLHVDSSLTTCRDRLGTAESQRGVCAAELAIKTENVTALENLRTRLVAERDSAQALIKPPSLFDLTFDVGVGAGCVYDLGDQKMRCGPSTQITVLRVRIPLF